MVVVQWGTRIMRPPTPRGARTGHTRHTHAMLMMRAATKTPISVQKLRELLWCSRSRQRSCCARSEQAIVNAYTFVYKLCIQIVYMKIVITKLARARGDLVALAPRSGGHVLC